MKEENSKTTSYKRIANNAIMLCGRMLLTTGINLYATRKILELLGFSDFGIYNVIAGFTSIFIFFTTSLIKSTLRFLCLSIANRNRAETQKTFCLSFTIYLFLALIVFVLLETIGYIAVNTQLIIPNGRIEAANIIFQFTVFSALISVLIVPFQSIVIAKEKMGIFATFSIYESLCRLVIVFVLYETTDRLISYGFSLLIIHISVMIGYILYCMKNFDECKLHLYWDRHEAKKLASFIGLTAYGGLAWSITYQGSNILSNMFFGPVINAARGVATQCSGALITFSNSILTATRPAITKGYASGDTLYLQELVIGSSKLNFILFALLSLPTIANMDYILEIWLGDAPDYARQFTILLIVDSLFVSMCVPIADVINATGKLKKMYLWGRLITLSSLPITYIAYKNKITDAPEFALYSLVISSLLYWIYCIRDMYKITGLDIRLYMTGLIVPVMKMNAVCIPLLIYLCCCSVNNVIFLIKSTCLLITFVLISTYFILLGKKEKKLLLSNLKVKIPFI